MSGFFQKKMSDFESKILSDDDLTEVKEDTGGKPSMTRLNPDGRGQKSKASDIEGDKSNPLQAYASQAFDNHMIKQGEHRTQMI